MYKVDRWKLQHNVYINVAESITYFYENILFLLKYIETIRKKWLYVGLVIRRIISELDNDLNCSIIYWVKRQNIQVADLFHTSPRYIQKHSHMWGLFPGSPPRYKSLHSDTGYSKHTAILITDWTIVRIKGVCDKGGLIVNTNKGWERNQYRYSVIRLL